MPIERWLFQLSKDTVCWYCSSTFALWSKRLRTYLRCRLPQLWSIWRTVSPWIYRTESKLIFKMEPHSTTYRKNNHRLRTRLEIFIASLFECHNVTVNFKVLNFFQMVERQVQDHENTFFFFLWNLCSSAFTSTAVLVFVHKLQYTEFYLHSYRTFAQV